LDFRQDYARGLQELLTTLALGPSTEQNVSAVSDAKSNGPSNVPRVDKRQLAPEQPSLEDAGREAIEQVERTKPERERTRRATHKESLAAGAIAALSVPKSKTSPTIRNVAVGAIIVIVVAAGAFFVASFLAPEVRPFLHLGKQTGVVSNSTQPKTATPGSTTSSSPLIGVLADTATFRDPDSLIEFRYPRRLFHREDVVESHEVVRLQSDEKVVISVSIVATDRDDALIRAYELDLETPGKPIHYKTGVHNGWYVVSGFDGPILFYRRVVSTRGHIAALTISHDKSITPSFNPAVVIAQTFRAID